jgi:hypothetical protein
MSRLLASAAPVSDLDGRDEAVLHSVSDLRFISGGQLGRMHFGPGDDLSAQRAARRALARLTRRDVLMRLPRRVGGVRAGSAGYVYSLASAGQRLAMERGWQPERRRRRSPTPGQAFLNHSLAVAELHTELIESDRSRRVELLSLSAEPACWRSFGGIGRQGQHTLKPDSYVRLGIGDFEDSYFIELDRGTEGSRTIEQKLREYVSYEATDIEQEQRGVFPKVLWLVPDERRNEQIERCVQRLPVQSRELFAVAHQADALDVVCGTSE